MERKKNSDKKFMHISLAHYEKLIDMLYFYTGIAEADPELRRRGFNGR